MPSDKVGCFHVHIVFRSHFTFFSWLECFYYYLHSSWFDYTPLILYRTGNIASLHTQKSQKNNTKQNNNTKQFRNTITNWKKKDSNTRKRKSYIAFFPALLWVSLDRIIVWAPSIPHFKDLGMRNLQYEMRICQKSHDKAERTKQSSI